MHPQRTGRYGRGFWRRVGTNLRKRHIEDGLRRRYPRAFSNSAKFLNDQMPRVEGLALDIRSIGPAVATLVH